MITAYRKNNMGTISFTAQFRGMKKPQEFGVYNIKADDDATVIVVQSDTRIGKIFLNGGSVLMSRPVPHGAYGHHLASAAVVATLTSEDLFILKSHVFATASGKAGSNGIVHCDNSGAAECFGVSA